MSYSNTQLAAWSRIMGGSKDPKDLEVAKPVIDRLKYLGLYR
jgi:hypothetical protein